jgi:hypothetical protein
VVSAIKNEQKVVRDPLAVVDEPIDAREALTELAFAETEAQAHRELLLKDSVSAAEAAILTGHSQLSIEELRKAGNLLALQAGNQWLYPRWQFEPDAPGGVLPRLEDVLRHLHLSSAGAAFWLLQPSERLGGASPIQLLRRHLPEPVIQLAREFSFTP